MVITNVKMKFPISRSNTHPEGRGVDISARGWNSKQVQNVIEYMQENVGHLGAYSLRTGKQNVIIYHDAGLGKHFHLQVHRGNL